MRKSFQVAVRASVIALACGFLSSPKEALAQSKTAIIDLRRAVGETEDGLRVQATLKKLFDSRQVDLDNKQKALLQEKESLEKEAQSGKTSKDVLQKKSESLQKQLNELQLLLVDYQKEMQRKETELTTPIYQKVMSALKRIAAQDGYEMILEKATAPYFRPDLELTDRVIQMCNSGQVTDAPTAPSGKTPTTKAPTSTPSATDTKKK